jgi:hypothetical protein
MDMTRVASGFSHPHPALPADEYSPAVAAMNAALWALVDVTLFRAKVALQHHGYDEVTSEINGAVADVADAWSRVLDPELGSAAEPGHGAP